MRFPCTANVAPHKQQLKSGEHIFSDAQPKKNFYSSVKRIFVDPNMVGNFRLKGTVPANTQLSN